MSTRSHIARQLSDGSIRVIYCHSDGYPSYNGKMLLEHYQDVAKIDELLDLGAISFLNENIGVAHDFNDYEFFNANKQVRAYGRDRNEADVAARRYPSLASFDKRDFEEYFYLHAAEGWQWFAGSKINQIQPLTTADVAKNS